MTTTSFQTTEPEALAKKSSSLTLQALLVNALRILLAVALLSSLLFAHGCHGNEDHELFTGWLIR